MLKMKKLDHLDSGGNIMNKFYDLNEILKLNTTFHFVISHRSPMRKYYECRRNKKKTSSRTQETRS